MDSAVQYFTIYDGCDIPILAPLFNCLPGTFRGHVPTVALKSLGFSLERVFRVTFQTACKLSTGWLIGRVTTVISRLIDIKLESTIGPELHTVKKTFGLGSEARLTGGLSQPKGP